MTYAWISVSPCWPVSTSPAASCSLSRQSVEAARNSNPAAACSACTPHGWHRRRTWLVERDLFRALVREQLPGVRRELEPLGLLARDLCLIFLLLGIRRTRRIGQWTPCLPVESTRMGREPSERPARLGAYCAIANRSCVPHARLVSNPFSAHAPQAGVGFGLRPLFRVRHSCNNSPGNAASHGGTLVRSRDAINGSGPASSARAPGMRE